MTRRRTVPLFAFETILFELARLFLWPVTLGVLLSFVYALHCLGAFGVEYPQWISAQKAEGYSGALQVLKTAQFLWGWQVTAPQTVRQDHWQSLHNVYVRDQYKLGTREWLEGDNRAASAQTLERMLDAVRLNYWQPDAATRRELAAAYNAARQASGLRESNAAVQRFAADAALAPGESRAQPSADHAARQPAPARPSRDRLADEPPQDAGALTAVRGLKLEPQVPTSRAPAAMVSSLAALWAVAVLLALGAWKQSRRWRRAQDVSAVFAPTRAA